MKNIFVAMILFTMLNGVAIAGELVRGAKILEVVTNATPGTPNFAIKIEGGTNPQNLTCVNERWLYFPESKVTPATYSQSLSIALAALATDKTVRVHNYENNLCSDADFISISR